MQKCKKEIRDVILMIFLFKKLKKMQKILLLKIKEKILKKLRYFCQIKKQFLN